MSNVVWTPDKNLPHLVFGESDEGDWILSPRGDVYDVKLRHAFPEGEDWRSMNDQFKALKDQGQDIVNGGFWSHEMQRIWSHMSNQELGFAQSLYEAKHYVECIREGDQALPPFEEMLEQNGFYLMFDHGERKTWYHRTLKSLSVAISDDTIWATYDRSSGTSWENITTCNGLKIGHNNESKHWTFWPAQVTDPRRVCLKHLMWVIENRKARGGLFRKALTEITKVPRSAVHPCSA